MTNDSNSVRGRLEGSVAKRLRARRAAVREARKSIDLHRRPDTAAIWRGMIGVSANCLGFIYLNINGLSRRCGGYTARHPIALSFTTLPLEMRRPAAAC